MPNYHNSGRGSRPNKHTGTSADGRNSGHGSHSSPHSGETSSQSKATRARDGGPHKRGSRLDKPHTDAPRYNDERRDTPRGDTPRGNTPRGDTFRGNTPRGDTPRGNTPRGNTPRGDTPRGNTPRGDTPRGNTPRGNTPRGDTPRGNTFRGDTPRGDTPRGDTFRQGSPRQENRPRGSRSQDGPQQKFRPQAGPGQRGSRQENRSQKGPRQEMPTPERDLRERPQPVTIAPPEQEQAQPYFLMGRNAVREALKSGRSIDRILVIPEQDGSLREILSLARDRGIVITQTPRAKLDEHCMPFGHSGKPGNHQGILAMVPEIEYCTIADILEVAKARDEAPFLLVLDEIYDPHNLGSMLRSAVCAGVHGVIIPKRRAASVTAAVAKASAGAIEYIKIAKVGNLTNALNELKAAGIWIAGGVMDATPMGEVDLRGAIALVIGSEGAGLSRLVRETCDHLVSIPMRGPLGSLNASVAAAVLLFEKTRQDQAGQG